MKATHIDRENNIPISYFTVKFTVNKLLIERCISHIKDVHPNKRITKKAVIQTLDYLLFTSGESTNCHDYDRTPDLEVIGQKLFPDFYKTI